MIDGFIPLFAGSHEEPGVLRKFNQAWGSGWGFGLRGSPLCFWDLRFKGWGSVFRFRFRVCGLEFGVGG